MRRQRDDDLDSLILESKRLREKLQTAADDLVKFTEQLQSQIDAYAEECDDES